MAFQGPADPKTIPERPLNKGMVLHLPPVSLADGAVLEAKNVDVGLGGISKRNGTQPYSSDTVDYGVVRNIVNLWKSDGTSQSFVMDDKFLYQMDSATLAATYNTYTSSDSVTNSGSTVYGVGTNWTATDADLLGGDIFVFAPSTTPEAIEISAVASSQEITLVSATTTNYSTTVEYEIRRAFGAAEPYYVDYTNNAEKIFFADGNRVLQSYDGTTLETTAQSSDDYLPNLVCYFNDRLFIGRTTESGAVKNQRIRWSGIGTSNHVTFEAENYIDLPYSRGQLLRLLPMGNFLVAYFLDKIYIGQGTNRSDLPVIFQPIETGNIGLVGQRAVAPYLDAHFFVGQDDIYLLSNTGFQRIGTPVVRRTVRASQDRIGVMAAVDYATDKAVFAFPDLGEIWYYNYKSQAWSYGSYDVDSVMSIGLVTSLNWGTLVDTGSGGILDANNWGGFPSEYSTWETLQSTDVPERQLYYGRDTRVWQDSTLPTDDGSAIAVEVITKDYDEGLPGENKLWRQFSVKLLEPVTSALTFTVSGSIDRGNTWKSLGNLVIDAGDDEGYVNFRLKGQLARFRLQSSTNVTGYTMVEFTRRVATQGRETAGRLTG